ncbi:hypothetical protein KSP39_PZI007852 [Platanthera zijinensis]|uniref:Uncharacterized protein n=1 Tax=Platanthera zijinensis TaxID=2320716 RepID=A0AAP0BNL6_9ASPA
MLDRIESNFLDAADHMKLQIDFLCGQGLISKDAFKILHSFKSTFLDVADHMKIQFLLQTLGFRSPRRIPRLLGREFGEANFSQITSYRYSKMRR